jgi:acyl carrier protein
LSYQKRQNAAIRGVRQMACDLHPQEPRLSAPIDLSEDVPMTCTPTPIQTQAENLPLPKGEAAGDLTLDSRGQETGDLEELVKSLLARYAHRADKTVAMRRPLLDMGIDVLELVEIVMDLETKFEIELDPDEILSWLTAADMVETLSGALRAS